MRTVSSDTETPSPTPERIRRIRTKYGLPRPEHARKKVLFINGLPPKGSVKDAICAILEARAGQKRNDFRPKVGAAERRDRTHGEKFVAASGDKYGTGNVYVNLGPASGARVRALDRQRIELHKRRFVETDAAERRDRKHGEKFVAASEDKYGTGNVYVNLGPATGARERALDRERIERRHKRHFFDTDAMGSEQECNVYLQ